VEFYGDEGNVLIAVSSSGKSENTLNGCKAARKSEFSSVITFSGFRSDNSLRKMGDVNLWVDSEIYNFVESIHQLWLVAIVDLINSKQECSI
jgi:D-sedoheptulose 7-phosphate isomerase